MAKAVQGQRKPTAIWLEGEYEADGEDKRKLFRCYNCGIPTIQYQGIVMTIVPGRTPYKPGTILKCKGNTRRDDGIWEQCGMEYCFMGVIYTQNPAMT